MHWRKLNIYISEFSYKTKLFYRCIHILWQFFYFLFYGLFGLPLGCANTPECTNSLVIAMLIECFCSVIFLYVCPVLTVRPFSSNRIAERIQHEKKICLIRWNSTREIQNKQNNISENILVHYKLNKAIEIIDISIKQLFERILVDGFKCLCK